MVDPRTIDHVVITVKDLDSVAQCYQALGFTLTPRARHDDRMGTSNRLIQFSSGNFIELLEVDRPRTLADHRFDQDPPEFSFGAFNRGFLKRGQGLSMLVLKSDDARADIAAFRAAGLKTYAPFDFGRKARLPDGSEVEVAFSLGFVTDPSMPGLAFFVCQNHYPQNFWKPDYQQHINNAKGIARVYISAPQPERHRDFLCQLTGGTSEPLRGGYRVLCGKGQQIVVLTPPLMRVHARGAPVIIPKRLAFCGITLWAKTPRRFFTPTRAARGLFIEWRPETKPGPPPP